MDSIIVNGTWEIINRPYNCKLVGCMWEIKNKLRPDGTNKMYNNRLVVEGIHRKKASTSLILTPCC
jgi:hypothetical protein